MTLRLMLSGASALALALLISVSNQTAVSAQQNQDMPYDLHFIDMMIMHHQEGIEMAQLAQTKAVKANVKAFATKAAAEQQKDIEELQAHRNHWYAGKPIMDHGMMQSMMQNMHGGMKMDMEDTRRKLRASQGSAFDRLFLETMIHHHQMAIEMGKEAIAKAEHPELREFARKAVAKQQAEITEMNKLKGGKVNTSRTTMTKPKPKAKTTQTHVH